MPIHRGQLRNLYHIILDYRVLVEDVWVVKARDSGVRGPRESVLCARIPGSEEGLLPAGRNRSGVRGVLSVARLSCDMCGWSEASGRRFEDSGKRV